MVLSFRGGGIAASMIIAGAFAFSPAAAVPQFSTGADTPKVSVVRAEFEKRLGIPPLTGFGAHRDLGNRSLGKLTAPRHHRFDRHGHGAKHRMLFKRHRRPGLTVIIIPDGGTFESRHRRLDGHLEPFKFHRHRHGFGGHKSPGFGGHRDHGLGLHGKGSLW